MTQPTAITDPDEYLSIQEVMARFNVTRSVVQGWIDSKKVTRYRNEYDSRQVALKLSEVQEVMASRNRFTPDPPQKG